MKRVLLTLCFLLTAILIHAQDDRPGGQRLVQGVLFAEETPKTFALKHIVGSFDHKEHSNSMIAAMGGMLGLTPANSYNAEMQYVESYKVEKAGEELTLSVHLRFTGLVSQQRVQTGFDVASHLYPDRMNFRLQMLDEGGSVLFEREFKEVELREGRNKSLGMNMVQLTIPDEYQRQKVTLRILEIVSPQAMLLFYHTPESSRQFSDFVANVRNYETDAALVLAQEPKVRAITTDNPDRLSEQMELLEKLKGEVDVVIQKGWPAKLNLQQHDPRGLVKGLETFATLYREKKEALQYAMKSMDETYYQKGMEFMRRQDYTNAMVWFNKAVGFNPKHAASHFQIATIEFKQGKTEEAAARANRILSTMSPNWGLSAEIQKLLEEIQLVMSKSYWDEYHRLVAVAEREWNAGRSVQALQALRRAADYQTENNIYVTDNARVLALADRIMKGMTQEAEKDVRAEKYDAAITKYEDLISFFRTHASGLVNVTPLEGRIREIREMQVNVVVKEAEAALRRGDFTRTETLINQALSQTVNQPNLQVSASVNNLLPQYQNELLNQGKRFLNEKSYARAFEILNQCLEAGNKYNLNQPMELQRLLDEARGGVFSGMLSSGQQAMNNRDLQSAEFYLREAINFLGSGANDPNKPALDAYKVNFMNAYLAEGQKWLSSKNFTKAIEWFDKAQQAQYSYGIPGNFNIQSLKLDAHDGIALGMVNNTENLLNRKSYPQALASLKEVYQYVQENGLAGQSKAKMITVADQYFRDVLQRIDVANRAKGFTGALEMIGEARYLCDHFPIRCDASIIDQRESESRQSIYNLLVTDADKALTRGDLGQAQSLLKEANTYQQAYPAFVNSTKESGQVAGKVRQRSYQQSVATGKSLLDRKEYKQALPHFDEAFLMEQEGGFTTDKKLRDYRTTAALHTLLLEADQLEQMLGQANYMATKDKMTQIMTMRTRYNLQDNKEIDQRLKSLQGRMVSAACLQQQRIYDEEMEKGRKLELEGKYIAAGEAYRKAAEAAKRHAECDLTDTLANGMLQRITPAIQYQEKMSEADKLLKAYKNTESFAAYAAAENLYNTHNLSQRGLNHEPASDYALKQNLNYILAAAFYYKEKGETGSVLKMLEALSNKGYPPSQTRLLQEQIGFLLGKQDRQKYTGSTWKVAVLQYTSGKKFYKYFRSAYKKGWSSK